MANEGMFALGICVLIAVCGLILCCLKKSHEDAKGPRHHVPSGVLQKRYKMDPLTKARLIELYGAFRAKFQEIDELELRKKARVDQDVATLNHAPYVNQGVKRAKEPLTVDEIKALKLTANAELDQIDGLIKEMKGVDLKKTISYSRMSLNLDEHDTKWSADAEPRDQRSPSDFDFEDVGMTGMSPMGGGRTLAQVQAGLPADDPLAGPALADQA